jgi:thiamine biosynthesis lipoprotein
VADVELEFRAMADRVRMRVCDPGPDAVEALRAARAVVERIARTCTRFDPDSDLQRANRAARDRADVDPVCAAAIAAAHEAYLRTDGLFDPRVDVAALGYAASWTGSTAASSLAPVSVVRRPDRWTPVLGPDHVVVGPAPLDLGGIGKGLAVAAAADLLAPHGSAVLVEAGGDLQALGGGPDGTGWLVGVEDPHGHPGADAGAGPLAVLRVTDGGCATSSTRVRRWTRAGEQVHHVVDPRTGRSARGGLAAVTVLDADAAQAEVWAKALLVAGAAAPALVARHGLAALWVTDGGTVHTSPAIRPHLVWEATRAA